jgi:NAD(P) transhydrogenase subunit alpha
VRIAVPRESAPGERRVATVPDVVRRLCGAGHDVVVETGAGTGAFFSDDEYSEAGATVVGRSRLYDGVDLVTKVLAPNLEEVAELPVGIATVSFLQPAGALDVVAALRDRHISAFSLDLLPRISRAQSIDALSSQATVTGYRGGLLAAEYLPRFFPMFMTAAGTVPPAKVFVLGAGVAGLQAIATARRLGALVRVNDVRPAAGEEVASLGATFVALPLESQEGQGGYARVQSPEYLERQRALIAEEVAKADAVITTAAVPGRPAPLLVTGAMVEKMSPGSVVIDLAAEGGGNCELTVAGEIVTAFGVTIYGERNIASQMAPAASFLYARNIAEFALLCARDGAFTPDFGDEIVSGCSVTRDGEITHLPTAEALGGPPGQGAS